jgi:hypothetical protein
MSHAIVEKKYACQNFPRSGKIGVAIATGDVTYVSVAEIAAGDGMVFVQADGADLYIASGSTPSFQVSPSWCGQPAVDGSAMGSVAPTLGAAGSCARLLCTVEPQKYILENSSLVSGSQGDLYIGFIVANLALYPLTSGPYYFRWWRSSMLSQG